VDSNDVWAVGYQSVTSTKQEPLVEHCNGTSWSVVSAVPSGVSSPDGVAALSDGTVVVVSESGAIVEN
jgi:hypothetical protein